VALSVLLLLGGLLAFRQLNIEAYPDPASDDDVVRRIQDGPQRRSNVR
jgi:hypothetical protein